MTATELGVFAVGLLAFLVPNAINIWGNFVQRRQAIALEESNRLQRQGGAPMSVSSLPSRFTSIPQAKWRFYSPMLVSGIFMLLTWAAVGISVYDRHRSGSSPDLRLAPLSSDLLSGIAVNSKQTFRMVCFPYDPDSCAIAAKYRDRLADYWTPEGTLEDNSNPAPIQGLQIQTQSEKRPEAAKELRERLRRATGKDVGFPVNVDVQDPNDFWVVIGSRY